MKKICSVVGARPQFIKLAVVSRVLRKEFQEVLIHTGQHYDHNMSDVFFEEMDIPKPDYNLGISGGSHGKMTGEMLEELEEVFMKEAPDMVLVFGDTNSTMAAALAAVKLHIPICHVEAGNRLGTLESPEEVNRIVTDHVSSLHLVCTPSGVEFLRREGFQDSVVLVGDPMYDAFCYYTRQLDGSELAGIVDFQGAPLEVPAKFYYLTCHRQENTDTDENLRGIFDAMEALDAPVIYPVHPRNHARAERLCSQRAYRNLLLTQPVGYQTSISLVNRAENRDRLRRCPAGGILRQKALRDGAGLCGLAGDHGQRLQSAGQAGKGGHPGKAVPARDVRPRLPALRRRPFRGEDRL